MGNSVDREIGLILGKLEAIHDEVRDLRPRLREVEEVTSKLDEAYHIHRKITIATVIAAIGGVGTTVFNYFTNLPH